MRIYLETERLILRRFTPDDVANLVELDSDPEVRRYLLLPDAPTPEQAAETLSRFLAWYERSEHYGYWAAVEKASGAFVGWFHFRPFRARPEEVELGYRFQQSAWGKGYATEGSRALLQKGFEELEIGRIVATTLAANTRSRRVMEKLGMTLESEFLYPDIPDHPAVKYSIDRNQFTTTERT